MIRLFRKIRHQLLSENNYSLYLLYAGGEIILVVVGILFALQINNWNEHRKEKAVELELLKSLKDEITANIEQMNNGINVHRASKEMCVSVLQHFGDPNRTINSEVLDSLVENISVPFAVNLKKGIVKSIIATGDLKYLENELIVEFVTVFEDKIKETNDDLNRLSRIYEELLWPLENKYIRRMNRALKLQEWFGYKIPNRGYSSDYDSFFSDILLENTYMLTLYEQSDLINGEELLLKHMESALELVKNELFYRNK